jgi:hypothetical protein
VKAIATPNLITSLPAIRRRTAGFFLRGSAGIFLRCPRFFFAYFRVRAPPPSNQSSKKIEWRNRMDANAWCYLWENGRRTAITYAELQEYQRTNPAFRRRRFWLFDDALIEVTEDEYRQLRREAHHHEYLREFEKSADVVPLVEGLFEDSQSDFESRALDDIMSESVSRMVDKLPANDARLIRSIFFEGKIEREVAALLGIGSGTANKRKTKILSKLRELLDKEI